MGIKVGWSMNIVQKMLSASDFVKVKFFNQRIPIAVRMEVTNRCPNKCSYCNVWNTKMEEPSKEKIFSIIGQLKKLGTKKISFSGGEPLLRDDIGEIIDYCKDLGISPEMNSCGFLIEKRISQIKNLDLLKISVDGPKDIHDALSKREGAYKDCIKAIELAKANGIRVSMATTITKHNIKHLHFLLQLAKKYDIKAAFQPLKPLYRGVGDEDMKEIYPAFDEYRRQIAKLIELKADGYSRYMRNSLIGLKHIYNWPNFPKLECSAGKLFCIIDTDGSLYPCDRITYDGKSPNCFEVGVKKALNSLPEIKCGGCGFCGSLELNFLFNFKFGALKEVLWLLK